MGQLFHPGELLVLLNPFIGNETQIVKWEEATNEENLVKWGVLVQVYVSEVDGGEIEVEFALDHSLSSGAGNNMLRTRLGNINGVDLLRDSVKFHIPVEDGIVYLVINR